VKPHGERVGKCSAPAFPARAREDLSAATLALVEPVLEQIEKTGAAIADYDRRIEEAAGRYPAVERLIQVGGVGTLTALAFVLAVQTIERFARIRWVAAFLGLVPRRDQSGKGDPELSISKAGNGYVRRLLVGSAHYILGPFGQDCDLRRWGLAKAAGGKSQKKRAVVATARKLSVLLASLWKSGQLYEPLRESARRSAAAAA
jgi:transposase